MRGAALTRVGDGVRRNGGGRSLVHAPGVDVDPVLEPASGAPGHLLDDRGPHVELDLLGHPQMVVQERREPITGPRPRLDLEHDDPVRRRGSDR